MDTATLDFNTLTLMVTLLLAITGSTITVVTLMLRQFNHLDTKIGHLDTKIGHLDAKIGNLDTRVTGLENAVIGLAARFDGLETRFDTLETRFDRLEAKFDRMARDVSDTRERVARVEGHLMAPGNFRMRGLDPPAPSEPAPDNPAPDNPDPDHRAAG